MTDNEILLALSNMIEPIRHDITDMRSDIKELQKDVTGMKSDIAQLQGDVAEMKGDIVQLQGDVTEMKGDIAQLQKDVVDIQGNIIDINGRLKKIELTQENIILPRLQNIESCYTSTYDRYRDHVEDYETMKQDITVLKKVVAGHSEKFEKTS